VRANHDSLSELSPELVLVMPAELRALALAALPARAPDDFLSFRDVPVPAPPLADRAVRRSVAALAYAARSALGMLVVGVGVITGIVALVLALQLVG
jgi:hypothetical protein